MLPTEGVKMWSAGSETKKRSRQIGNYTGRSEWLWSKEHFNVTQVKKKREQKSSQTDEMNKKQKNEQESEKIVVNMKMEDVEREPYGINKH